MYYKLTGVITNSGMGNIIEKGVCYLTGTGTPTINDSKMIDNSSSNDIACNLNSGNMSNGNTYSWRAYAKNSHGTVGYGAVQTLELGSITGSFGNTSFSGSIPTGEFNYNNGLKIFSSNLLNNGGNYPYIYFEFWNVHTGNNYSFVMDGGNPWNENISYDLWISYPTSYGVTAWNTIFYDASGNKWLAESLTMNITQYDTVAKRFSLAVNAVMFKESETTWNSSTWVLNLSNASRQTLTFTITNAELFRRGY